MIISRLSCENSAKPAPLDSPPSDGCDPPSPPRWLTSTFEESAPEGDRYWPLMIDDFMLKVPIKFHSDFSQVRPPPTRACCLIIKRLSCENSAKPAPLDSPPSEGCLSPTPPRWIRTGFEESALEGAPRPLPQNPIELIYVQYIYNK